MEHEPLVTEEMIARQPREAQAIIRIPLAKIEQLEARINRTSLIPHRPLQSASPCQTRLAQTEQRPQTRQSARSRQARPNPDPLEHCTAMHLYASKSGRDATGVAAAKPQKLPPIFNSQFSQSATDSTPHPSKPPHTTAASDSHPPAKTASHAPTRPPPPPTSAHKTPAPPIESHHHSLPSASPHAIQTT